MPKQCKADDCENAIFSNLYCKWHQSLRKDKKWLKSILKQRKGTSIKPISDKQRSKLIKYDKAKAEKEKMLKANKEWKCIFCDEYLKDDEEYGWHHLKGRDGDLVFDDEFIFPAHSYCHVIIYHWADYVLLSSHKWYKGFLERLKAIDIKLYDKEMRKKEKHDKHGI